MKRCRRNPAAGRMGLYATGLVYAEGRLGPLIGNRANALVPFKIAQFSTADRGQGFLIAFALRAAAPAHRAAVKKVEKLRDPTRCPRTSSTGAGGNRPSEDDHFRAGCSNERGPTSYLHAVDVESRVEKLRDRLKPSTVSIASGGHPFRQARH
jgi:hypothetical protein